MDITVLGIDEAYKAQKNFDLVVSLVDKDVCPVDLVRQFSRTLDYNHFVESFEDIKDVKHPDCPKLEHIVTLLQKLQKVPNIREKKILVHCHGGVSRSTAMSVILHLYFDHDLDMEQAFEKVFSIREMMWPNDLLIELADSLFKYDGALIKFNEEWKKDALGIYWSRPPIRVKPDTK